jgi:hypothetical protein
MNLFNPFMAQNSPLLNHFCIKIGLAISPRGFWDQSLLDIKLDFY